MVSFPNNFIYEDTLSLYKSKIDSRFWVKLPKDIRVLELTNILDKDNKSIMPNISDFKELEELDIIFTYKELSKTILDLPKLKIFRTSRNILSSNDYIFKELSNRKVKIEYIGI